MMMIFWFFLKTNYYNQPWSLYKIYFTVLWGNNFDNSCFEFQVRDSLWSAMHVFWKKCNSKSITETLTYLFFYSHIQDLFDVDPNRYHVESPGGHLWPYILPHCGDICQKSRQAKWVLKVKSAEEFSENYIFSFVVAFSK